MAQVKFITVNANGIYVDHDSTSADLTLNSIQLGSGAAAAPGGMSLDGGLEMNTSKITGLDAPTAAGDAANKGYVDSTVTGLDVKDSVKYITTAEISSILTANQATVESALDQVGASAPTLVSGDRILVKDQSTNAEENGIYVFDGTNIARSTDADQDAEVTPGLFTFVEQGDTFADTGWVLSSDGPITVGTTSIAFTQFSSAGQVVGGNGFVTRAGNVVEFTELTDQNVVIGNATDNPAKVGTTGAGTAGSAGSNQIEASTANALVIKANVISDDQVNSSANIDATKLQIQNPFSPAAASSAPVAVVADDLVSSAIEKLQQHLNALGSTGAGVGASLVSIGNLSVPSLTSTNVQDAIDELVGQDFTAGTGGVTLGDVVFVSAANEIQTYATITNLEYPIGIAAESAIASATSKVISGGVVEGLSGLTPGTRYYWDGSALVSTLPGLAGQYIWQIGTATDVDKLLVDIDLVKRNTP